MDQNLIECDLRQQKGRDMLATLSVVSSAQQPHSMHNELKEGVVYLQVRKIAVTVNSGICGGGRW